MTAIKQETWPLPLIIPSPYDLTAAGSCDNDVAALVHDYITITIRL